MIRNIVCAASLAFIALWSLSALAQVETPLKMTNPPHGGLQGPVKPQIYNGGDTVKVTWTGNFPHNKITVRVLRWPSGWKGAQTVLEFVTVNNGAADVVMQHSWCGDRSNREQFNLYLESDIGYSAVSQPILVNCVTQPQAAPPQSAANCKAPPEEMAFWTPLDVDLNDAVAGVKGSPNGAVYLGANKPNGHSGRSAQLGRLGSATWEAAPDRASPFGFGVGDFSIDAWIRMGPYSGGPSHAPIMDTRTTTTSPSGIYIYIQDGYFVFGMHDGVTSQTDMVSLAPIVADLKWHHVAVTADRDNPKGLVAYIDGA